MGEVGFLDALLSVFEVLDVVWLFGKNILRWHLNVGLLKRVDWRLILAHVSQQHLVILGPELSFLGHAQL